MLETNEDSEKRIYENEGNSNENENYIVLDSEMQNEDA